jgi:succinyl-CoA synthetase alpha subunit
MHSQGIGGFPYYLGIHSLADVATRGDRVCVLNILGGESRQVTPTSHVFSGGNVVFGTSPGRSGQSLKTAIGDIPVFNTVREGLDAGHAFNTGVVYLPPSGVRDGVAELIRVNPDLKKIVIITEKIAVHDAREIRAMAQGKGVDIIGGNCLGVADSWSRTRIGGALGGDHPEESLLQGTVAIFSNSGGFTTTIAQYLATEGWGTTTLVSSGKDVYIHYAARDFAHAFRNDGRSRAAVLYAEPGGYYEHELDFGKPVVACVVGRWKSRLSRAVGHAGAMAGSGDRAEDKERWFMQAFGVDGLYTPEQPVVSRKGAVVTNIAHIPAALTAVMKLSGARPDLAPRGSLALKAWIANDQGIALPAELALEPVTAPEPYAAQIAELGAQVGAVVARQNMKDRSGASVMDPKTQVTSVHGKSVLELALEPLQANFALPLVHEVAGPNDRALLDIAVAAEVNLVGDPILVAADAARVAGNSPNTVMAAAVAIVGPGRVSRTLACSRALIEAFAGSGLKDGCDEGFDFARLPPLAPELRELFLAGADEADDPRPEAMLEAVRQRGARSVFLRYVLALDGRPSRDAVLAAIATTIAWAPLVRKRISRLTAETLPWYLRLYGVMVGASIPGREHQRGSLCGIPRAERFGHWTMADLCFLAMTGKKPTEEESRPLQMLIGLLISNGPGSISAQGAKGAVAADGPQTPARVQINKAMAGFLTHTGYSHGGNGFEGMAFLLEQFKSTGLADPTDASHGIDLKAMAATFAKAYKADKRAAKEGGGEMRALPGVHHPVFKGKPVNHDPRERFIASYMARRGDYNVFHAYYLELVQALYASGATPYVFCVNVDAVIAALLLALLWKDYKAGALTERDLERAAFTVFLYGRMIGAAAEIDDHLNRGRNMDTRTPEAACSFVM